MQVDLRRGVYFPEGTVSGRECYGEIGTIDVKVTKYRIMMLRTKHLIILTPDTLVIWCWRLGVWSVDLDIQDSGPTCAISCDHWLLLAHTMTHRPTGRSKRMY